MKVIDLLNLVYEKKAPKRILYKYCEYEFDYDINDYKNKDGLELFGYLFMNEVQALYLEVEIIEEEKEIEEILIQANRKVTYRKDKFIEGMLDHFYNMDLEVRNKLNEVIRKLNKIEKEGK